ncbi:MAG TPA: SDR family NAD(P)-dependent oxidoreductase [Candidatus Sulfotelmatobacter sp.]|nr:SDR family NAD(P)-dependent oxidoreductase [Candidatus Sulfotelmatobacter sp.]
MTRLAGKIAVITGGGSGIGRSIALAFGREGAKVAVFGRTQATLDAVVKEIAGMGAEGLAVACDVTRTSEIGSAVETVERLLGAVNVLVNNAGILSVSTAETITEQDWDRVITTNLKGPFLMSRAVLPAFRRAGHGSIVNIGSVLGLVAMRDRAAYCASKGGLTLLTKAMALDHAHEHIRVNCICPAIVETELVKDLFDGTEQGRKARDARIGTLPLGRFGTPADIAELAVFLASDESSWMTGAAIPVDGGLSAY